MHSYRLCLSITWTASKHPTSEADTNAVICFRSLRLHLTLGRNAQHGSLSLPSKVAASLTSLVLLGITATALLTGCTKQVISSTAIITTDGTGSTTNLHDEFLTIADQIVGKELDPDCIVIGRSFRSDINSSPYFQGTASDVDGFHQGTEAILARKDPGEGTYGGPVMRQIREDAVAAHAENRDSLGVIISDGGFNDLDEVTKEAELLANTPGFRGLFILPVTDEGDFAQRLKDALKPLGTRARLATRHDLQEAMNEVRELAKAPVGGSR